MKKNTTADFYFRISLWIFLCLILAMGFDSIKAGVNILLRSDNELFATHSIKTIKTLQAQYASEHQGKYAPNFDELIKAENSDEYFTGLNPVVNGYVFTMKIEESSAHRPAFYSVNA